MSTASPNTYSISKICKPMKYVRQFGVVVGVSFAAEIIKRILPLPIPAAIYGLLLMLFALSAGIIKLEWVEDTALFLTGLLQLIFIPPAAGLIVSYASFGGVLIQSVLAVIVSTILVIGATGLTVQFVQRLSGKKVRGAADK